MLPVNNESEDKECSTSTQWWRVGGHFHSIQGLSKHLLKKHLNIRAKTYFFLKQTSRVAVFFLFEIKLKDLRIQKCKLFPVGHTAEVQWVSGSSSVKWGPQLSLCLRHPLLWRSNEMTEWNHLQNSKKGKYLHPYYFNMSTAALKKHSFCPKSGRTLLLQELQIIIVTLFTSFIPTTENDLMY